MSRGTFVPRAPSRPRLADEKPSTALVVRLLLIVLSATALGVSVFLAYMALSGKILPGCSNEGILNCDMVLSTKWSKWFNLPVALPAASLYAGLLGLLLFTFGYAPPEVRRMAWRVIAVLAASAALGRSLVHCAAGRRGKALVPLVPGRALQRRGAGGARVRAGSAGA